MSRINNVLVICNILLCYFSLLQCQEQAEEKPDLKTFFNPVSQRPVKPTSAVVHHEPGLPPGWTKPPTRPTRHPDDSWFNPYNILSNSNMKLDGDIKPDSNDTIVESQIISIITTSAPTLSSTEPYKNSSLPPGVHPPEAVSVDLQDPNKNGVVDWFFGLFGGNHPTNKPDHKPPISTHNCKRCTCGVTYKHNRIVGGIETQVNEYPWMAFLTYNGRFYCGASVINDRYILTAAHCVNGFQRDRLGATFLDHDRGTPYETKTFTRKISSVLKHNGYDTGGNYNNDIALLRLDEELQFTGLLKPVCLPPIGKSFTGYTGVVTGWGATESHGQISTKLREVEVPIMSNIDCRQTGYGSRITDNMLCAGYPQGMKDSCQGDSGGPLHLNNGSFHQIVGIVSWGEGCAEPNYPGVYTRVNRYISWIKSNTRDACYC